jgi:hypothetical protein
VRDFEFDDGNRGHLAAKGIDDNLVWDVWGGEPRYLRDTRPDKSGSHWMVGQDSHGDWWTIVLTVVDDTLARWRPITGWPSTNKELRTWRGEA